MALRGTGMPGDRTRCVAFILAALLLYVGAYKITKAIGHTDGMAQTHFTYLADAFLRGHLDVDAAKAPWLSELVPHHGKSYVVYPPMPAVLLMPWVAAFGAQFPSWAFSISLASLCVGGGQGSGILLERP